MLIFGPVNEAMFDWPWSGIHFVSGLLIGLVLVTWPRTRFMKRFWFTGIGLLILWELFEFTLRTLDIYAHEAVAPLKQTMAGWFFAKENLVNVIGDIVIGVSGLWLSRIVPTITKKQK